MIKNNQVCDVKYITTYILTSIPLDLRSRGQPKEAPEGAY